MAAKKSKKYPHKWPDGTYHSIPWEQTKQYAQWQKDARAGYEASKPVAPQPVAPFLTGEDLTQISQFMQTFEQLMGYTDDQGVYHPGQIDTALKNLEIDTDYQKTVNDRGAKQSTSDTSDDMASRGLFRSSIKDAALYDIEATRALQQKFLDDKLTQARLDAGTQKGALTRGKEAFDKAIAQKKLDNAAAINDQASAAWAAQVAEWQANRPAPLAPPAGAKPPAKGLAAPTKGSPVTLGSKPKSPARPANQSPTKSGKVKTVYGKNR